MNTVHVVVPAGIDDPTGPSGGNIYDRRVCRGLAASGWTVHEHTVCGEWPFPNAAGRADLTRALTEIPDGSVVLLDGLVASTVPEVLVPASRRLRMVVVVHMPLGGTVSEDSRAARECEVLSASVAVITTSTWTQRWLQDRYGLPAAQIHVAAPGVDPADLATGTSTGGELLCVAAVTPDKGHDVLLAALATVADPSWRLVCVGTLARDPSFVERLGRQAREDGIGDRVLFTGPLTGTELDAQYAAADALVLASRAETYGMVVAEGLAHGLPVLATTVGGLPEALGRAADGSRPGLLVPAGDPESLAGAVRCWLDDPGLRRRFRQAARERRAQLQAWSVTSDRVSRVLAEVAR